MRLVVMMIAYRKDGGPSVGDSLCGLVTPSPILVFDKLIVCGVWGDRVETTDDVTLSPDVVSVVVAEMFSVGEVLVGGESRLEAAIGDSCLPWEGPTAIASNGVPGDDCTDVPYKEVGMLVVDAPDVMKEMWDAWLGCGGDGGWCEAPMLLWERRDEFCDVDGKDCFLLSFSTFEISLCSFTFFRCSLDSLVSLVSFSRVSLLSLLSFSFRSSFFCSFVKSRGSLDSLRSFECSLESLCS